MRRMLMAAVLAAGLAGGPAPAQEADIQGVISAQIEAFLRDDFAAAFDFASPTIQGMFGTPERFGTMVRNGYPMVWRPGSVAYLDLEPRDGRLHQRVRITDRGGAETLLDYEMVETGAGWRIDAVRILPAPDLGV